MSRRFAQVDVFASGPLSGNPVAVVVDADGLSDAQMAAFASWTNLSETTFLLPPTDPAADYRVRIFTPGSELPFAGHPTLGSAHAWLGAGGTPRTDGVVVQECGIGLVTLRHTGGRLAFAAPPLRRSGPVEPGIVDEVIGALGVERAHVVATEWLANGPNWIGVQLDSAQRVLAVRPDLAALGSHEVGICGFSESPAPGEALLEVRAFAPAQGVPEDPVTGSLNAAIAVWLRREERIPASYVAAQGSVLGRAGRVSVTDDGTDIWVGGASRTHVTGTLDL
ncbi:MAG: PhzF family phenazine biosynthesis protein [Gordonia sp. (in: high G+C Gram-positive bacteria)]